MNNDLHDKAKDNIKWKSNFYSKQYKRFYDTLSESDKELVFDEVERSQALYIKSEMAKMNKCIQLILLGKFVIKGGRMLYYKFKQENPDATQTEIVEMIRKFQNNNE